LFSSWGDIILDNRGKAPESFVFPEHIDLPEYLKDNEKIKAVIGWNGIIIRSSDIDIVDLCREYVQFLHNTSCGKCVYCKTGSREILEILKDIYEGEADEDDLDDLTTAAKTMTETSLCSIGVSGPVPILHALEYFRDDFSDIVNGKRSVKKGKYHTRLNAPCMDACPIHVDIPAFIRSIKEAGFKEALDIIKERLPMPAASGRICFKPCEKSCRRANLDMPLAISALKRFVADYDLNIDNKSEDQADQAEPSGRTGKIAVIGAGPAGLACAYHLSKKGHDVTVFDRESEPGGMMAAGIPEYRLPRDILFKETEAILNMNIDFKGNISFNDQITLNSLKSDGFQAVFFGVGLHKSLMPGVEGENLEGVLSGIKFLKDPGPKFNVGKNVVVTGGGNVAIDSAITCKLAGADNVTIVCIESFQQMPALKEEIDNALKKGIKILDRLGPERFTGKQGKVTGAVFKRCTRVFDEKGGFNPEYDETKTRTIHADKIIIAIGQTLTSEFADDSVLCKLGKFCADPVTFQTDLKSVFAGGDAVYGAKSVSHAMASGLKAAVNIDRFINNVDVGPDYDDNFDSFFEHIKIFDPDEDVKVPKELIEKKPPHTDPEKGFSESQAVCEANRCLRCYRVVTLAV